MMSPILDSVDIDQIESFRLVVVALFVVTTIGVWVGVYWEKEKFTDAKRHRGWLLLLCSLGAETLFTILIFGADHEISRRQKDEIISLQKKLAPRILSSEQQRRMVEAINPLPKFSFDFAAFGPEPIDLAQQIAEALQAAGNEWKEWSAGNTLGGLRIGIPGKPSVGFIVLHGVDIRIVDPAIAGAMDALVDELKSAGIEKVRGRMDPASAWPPNSTTMHIMIGPRP